MTETVTAIIKDISVGFIDHYSDIMLSCDFDMNGCGTFLHFTMNEAKGMMKDAKIYNDINSLVGLPCQLSRDENRTYHFIGMWKK